MMTHEERRQRREQIVELFKQGLRPKELAQQFSMTHQHVNYVLRTNGIDQKQRLTPPQERELHEWRRQWSKENILLCHHLPNGVCDEHHGEYDLELLDLPDGRYAFACTGKIIANCTMLGLTGKHAANKFLYGQPKRKKKAQDSNE